MVKDRENVRCARCGTPCPTGEWHHRRSRRARDEHRHCPCVGVWLCGTCHRWVHAHPFEAKATGFIVSIHVSDPYNHPVTTVWGKRTHDCEGNYNFEKEET